MPSSNINKGTNENLIIKRRLRKRKVDWSNNSSNNGSPKKKGNSQKLDFGYGKRERRVDWSDSSSNNSSPKKKVICKSLGVNSGMKDQNPASSSHADTFNPIIVNVVGACDPISEDQEEENHNLAQAEQHGHKETCGPRGIELDEDLPPPLSSYNLSELSNFVKKENLDSDDTCNLDEPSVQIETCDSDEPVIDDEDPKIETCDCAEDRTNEKVKSCACSSKDNSKINFPIDDPKKKLFCFSLGSSPSVNTDSPSVNTDGKSDAEVKPFKCSYCRESFATGNNYKNHYYLNKCASYCHSCSTQLSSEKEFETHYERCVFKMKYYCRGEKCQKSHFFGNSCQLLRHLKTDECRKYYIKKSKLTKLTLPIDMSSYMTKKSRLAQTDTDKKLIRLSTGLRVCPGCTHSFPNAQDLADHLAKISKGPEDRHCRVCHMTMPNNCAMKGHNLIHKLNTDLSKVWCPECGFGEKNSLVCFSNMADVFHHLDECCHFNKIRSTQCACNAKLYDYKNAIKIHILYNHMETMYVCPVCLIEKEVVLTKNLSSHLLDKHNQVQTKESVEKPVILCTICKKLSYEESAAMSHLEMHYKELSMQISSIYKWKCFVCDVSFLHKWELKEHASKKDVHPHRAKRCHMCFGLFSNRKLLVDHVQKKQCTKIQTFRLNVCLDSQSNHAFWANSLFNEIKKKFPGNSREESKSILCKPEPIEVPEPTAETAANMCIKLPPLDEVSSLKENPYLKKAMLQHIEEEETYESVNIANNVKAFRPETIFHQCHLCKMLISGKININDHAKWHKKKGDDTEEDVTRCAVCRKLVAHWTLVEHLKQHQVDGAVVCSGCQRMDFETLDEALQHSKDFCNYTYTKGSGVPPGGLDESGMFPDMEKIFDLDYRREPKIKTKREVGTEIKDGDMSDTSGGGPELDKESDIQKVKPTDKKDVYLYYCLLCDNEGGGRIFNETFDATAAHLRSIHSVCDSKRVKRLIKSEMKGSKLNLNALVNTSQYKISPFPPKIKGLRIDRKGLFVCSVCSFVCRGGELFSKHIISHKPDKGSQCPECGKSFDDIGDLKNHLHVDHKIRLVEEYVQVKGLELAKQDDNDISHNLFYEFLATPDFQKHKSIQG